MINNIILDKYIESSVRVVISRVVDDIENISLLSDNEKAQYSTLKNNRRKGEWLTTRLLIKHLFGNAIEVYHGKNGEPYIDCGVQISISHSEGMVAIAISDSCIGIDIENADRNFSKAVKRYLSDKERVIVSSDCYGVAWCVKEALFKKLKGDDVTFISELEITDLYENSVTLLYEGESYDVKWFLLKHNIIVAYI